MRYRTNPKRETLGVWVQHIRSQYKQIKNKQNNGDRVGSLDERRVSALKSIGFVWDARENLWEMKFQELVKYKEENGDCNVPTAKTELGRWVNAQRVSYQEQLNNPNSKSGGISKEHIERLEKLGFVWKFRKTMCWDDRYKQLVLFRQQHGHTMVPQHYLKDRHFGRWISKQREQYRLLKSNKPSQITPERIELLDRLGFIWDAKNWRDMKRAMDNSHGTAPIPYKDVLLNRESKKKTHTPACFPHRAPHERSRRPDAEKAIRQLKQQKQALKNQQSISVPNVIPSMASVLDEFSQYATQLQLNSLLNPTGAAAAHQQQSFNFPNTTFGTTPRHQQAKQNHEFSNTGTQTGTSLDNCVLGHVDLLTVQQQKQSNNIVDPGHHQQVLASTSQFPYASLNAFNFQSHNV